MGDEFFGRRNPFTGEPMGDRDEWSSWDFSLLYAFQTIEDFTDPESGIPQWQLDDDLVEVNAVKKFNKFKAAVDIATKGRKDKPYEPAPGEYFVPDVFTRRSDGHIQTYREWVESQVQSD